MEDDEDPGKDDIEVGFENVEAFLGYSPAPCRVFLGKFDTDKQPSLFWRLSGSGQTTATEDKSNLEMWRVKIQVSFRGELEGEHQRDASALMLKPNVQPDTTTAVILPVIVNHREIAAKDRLLLYKVTAEPKAEKRQVEQIDAVTVWNNKRRTAADGPAAKASASSKSGPR